MKNAYQFFEDLGELENRSNFLRDLSYLYERSGSKDKALISFKNLFNSKKIQSFNKEKSKMVGELISEREKIEREREAEEKLRLEKERIPKKEQSSVLRFSCFNLTNLCFHNSSRQI